MGYYLLYQPEVIEPHEEREQVALGEGGPPTEELARYHVNHK
jgi:hypothetical protein